MWIREHYFAVSFDILTECDTINDLDFYERMWIHVFRERGYRLFNLSSGGQRGEMLPEVREKISKGLTGKVRSEESKAKQAAWWSEQGVRGERHPNYGKEVSDETRKRLAEAKLGTKASFETRLKMSKDRLARGYQHHLDNHQSKLKHCNWCRGAKLQEEIQKREKELNDNKVE